MFARIWSYDVVAASVGEFERVYAPDGDWAELFRCSPGFRGTELFRSQGEGLRYLTVDHFEDECAWRRFLGEHRAEYDALDARSAGLCTAEQEIWSGNLGG